MPPLKIQSSFLILWLIIQLFLIIPASAFANISATDNPALNAIVKELYLEPADTSNSTVANGIINSLISNKATIIIANRNIEGLNTNGLYVGIATNEGWISRAMVCAYHFNNSAAHNTSILTLPPANNSNVRGYIVLEFPEATTSGTSEYPDLNIIAQNVTLNKAIAQHQCWPTILQELTSGFVHIASYTPERVHNTGSVDYPLASVSLGLKFGSRLKLRRNDRFYTNLHLDGHTIDAYGEGNPPEVCGLMIIPNIEGGYWKQGTFEGSSNDYTWKEDKSGKIWRLNLSEVRFGGFVPDADKFYLYKNIGTIVNYYTGNPLNCMKCVDPKDLNQNYDIFQDIEHIYNIPDDYGQYLYLYYNLPDSPNSQSWALTAGSHGIEMTNSLVSNIAVRYWGRHGISASSNSYISNCDIEYIGGSMIYDEGSPSNTFPYGNGVEIWMTLPASPDSKVEIIHDVSVQNCFISHCYDAGLTFQGRYYKEQTLPNGINFLFKNNRVSNCGYGLEIWDSIEGERIGREGTVKDCRVTQCTFEDSGFDTGFRYTTYQNSTGKVYTRTNGLLRSGFSKKTGCLIDNCTFINGDYLLEVDDNTNYPNLPQTFSVYNNNIIIRANQSLITTLTQKHVLIPEGNVSNVVAEYRAITADTTSTITIIDEDQSVKTFMPEASSD